MQTLRSPKGMDFAKSSPCESSDSPAARELPHYLTADQGKDLKAHRCPAACARPSGHAQQPKLPAHGRRSHCCLQQKRQVGFWNWRLPCMAAAKTCSTFPAAREMKQMF
eukprot:scaffold5487_cov19-Tisochrysis_lutea.AAC.5